MTIAKKILLILIIIGISIPNNFLILISSYSTVYSHYQEHLTNHNSISFIDFLILHNSDKEHLEDDDKEHNHLPFKNFLTSVNQIVALPSFFEKVVVEFKNDYFYKVKISKKHIFSKSNYFGSIWQPPKIV